MEVLKIHLDTGGAAQYASIFVVYIEYRCCDEGVDEKVLDDRISYSWLFQACKAETG